MSIIYGVILIFTASNFNTVLCLCQAVVEQDPAYVVRRFESGKYAVDSEVRSIYLEVTVLCTHFILCFSIFALLSGSRYVEWGKQNDV